MTQYLNEVKTVSIDNDILGFITRKSVIYGINHNHEDNWFVTANLRKPRWRGGFPTRKQAVKFLQLLQNGKIILLNEEKHD